MIVTVNSVPIVRGYIAMPRRGAWRADVEINGGNVLSGAASIVAGDLTLVGTFVPNRGGVSAGVGRYLVRGALAWDAPVKPRSYQSDPGLRLLTVLADLAKEIGEKDRIVMPPDRVLGNHECRYGTGAGRVWTAADLLTRLVPVWHVDPSGIVRCVERPSGAVLATSQVLRRNLSRRLRIVGSETPAAFVPGLTFEGDMIGSVVVSLSKSSAVLSLWSVT